MNIRDAILKTADLIERFPEHYNFLIGYDDDGISPACALVWIGRFANYDRCGTLPAETVARRVLGLMRSTVGGQRYVGSLGEVEFFRRMDQLSSDRFGWMLDAEDCARALRKYANEYHPVPKGMPAIVRAIFYPESKQPVCEVS